MKAQPYPPRSYRRFHAALQEQVGLENESAVRDAIRAIFDRMVTLAVGKNGHRAARTPVDLTALAVQKQFDQWDWRDTGAASPGSDLLGYLFERSLERKSLGAYFTPPDVVEYLARSTIIPRLFDLLEMVPDVRELAGEEGVHRYLPAGLRLADRLSDEADYEQRQRLQRISEMEEQLRDGGIKCLDDCVTLNLELERIALDFIAKEPDERVVSRLLDCLRQLKVLDPTCGSGDFLLGAFHLLARLYAGCATRLGFEPEPSSGGAITASLSGIDLIPGAVEICEMRLLLARTRLEGGPQVSSGAHLHVGDVLEPYPKLRQRGYDVVIGNPPYIDCSADRTRLGSLGYETAACGNLYAPVMERSRQLLAPGGRMGMIVPISSVSGPDFLPLADQLLKGTAWVSTFSNRPATLFEGVEQRIAVWLVAPDAPGRLYTSSYQHWYTEERPQLFERLHYAGSPVWPVTRMPVKAGSPRANTIFSMLCDHESTLGDLSAEGDAAVWLHDGPTYWVRALAFEPNVGRGSGRSGHYHQIATADSNTAHLLAAVLSSSTFYLFFKLTSNCRDLGRKEWSRFPIEAPTRELAHQLVEISKRFQLALRQTARVRTRVYPSGPVEYEEYFPAQLKSVIDEIDGTLAVHYGFDSQELEYILNYDLKYRLGRGT